MGSRKRNREVDLLIKVAIGHPLQAESFVLRSFSNSARGLPAAAEEWDVSGLLLDGQPFSRETVSCWLSCGYSAVDGMQELGHQDIQLLSTVEGLTQVLAFAAAVGSVTGFYRVVSSQLQQLKFVVQLPEQVLELPLAGNTYELSPGYNRRQQMSRSDLQNFGHVGTSLAHEYQHIPVQQQVAKQAAALLQLAHVLRLQPLLDMLLQFLLLNAQPPGGRGLLSGAAGLVFTDAVLEAALGSSTLNKEAYISSVMSQPCSLSMGDSPGGVAWQGLFKPTGTRTYTSGEDGDIVEFDAELLRDFAGGRAGDTVRVILDLFGSEFGGITIVLEGWAGASHVPCVELPVQLLVGHAFSNDAASEHFLNLQPQQPEVAPAE